MARLPKLYPEAIHKMDGSGSGSWSGRGHKKLVVHTTETRHMPGYDNGKLAPHLTFWPARRTITQHSPLDRPSESVRTYDDDEIFQIEIIAYSAEHIAESLSPPGVKTSELDDGWTLQAIARFTNWLRNHGVPIQPAWPGRIARSYSEANAAGFRFTPTEFFDWPALLGHQHVPGNTHWDPGAFPWPRLIQLITKGDKPMWNQPGDPIEDVADADVALAYQGSLAPGVNQASYEPSTLAEANDRLWTLAGRVADLFMIHDRRIRDLDARLASLEESAGVGPAPAPPALNVEKETIEIVKGVSYQ